jgi:general stress protein CsbA
MGKYLAALFFPGLLVVLFTRVTYNALVGLVLTVALIAISVYRGYTDTWPILIIDALSLTAGFWYSRRMSRKFV